MFDIFKKAKEHPLKAAIAGRATLYFIARRQKEDARVETMTWTGHSSDYAKLASNDLFDNRLDAEAELARRIEEGKLIEKLIVRDEFEGFESEVVETKEEEGHCTVDDFGCHVSGFCSHD